MSLPSGDLIEQPLVDGFILPSNDPLQKELTFTPDKFQGWLYYYKKRNIIYFVEVKELNQNRGHFRELIRCLDRRLVNIRIVEPGPYRAESLFKIGFRRYHEYHTIILDATVPTLVAVWSRDEKAETREDPELKNGN